MRHALGIPSGRPRLLALAAAVAAAGLLAAGCSSTFDSAPTLTTSSPVPGAAAVWTYRGAGTAECADPFGSGIYPLTVDLTAPAGTSFPAGASDYVLTDVDSAVYDQAAQATSVSLSGPAAVDLTFPGSASNTDDTYTLTVSGVENPPAGAYSGSAFTVGVACQFGYSPVLESAVAAGLSFLPPVPPLGFADVTSAVWSGAQGPVTVYEDPSAAVGQYFFDVLHADGGHPPYTWSLASGALPPGIALYPSGALLGRPTAAGTYTFTARVTDLSLRTFDRSVTITVAP